MPRNAALFVWFRLLFNCRFYYPVYTILFLDFGLNLSQFAALNVIWALSIVLLEVPSGAMADVIGRRNLVVLSAVLMVVEMTVFALLPVGGPWVFWVFAINRVLSGAAEAFSSGADEALAYDSIPEGDRSTIWPTVIGRLSRWMALGFIVTSLLGAYVYDVHQMNRLLGWLGAGEGVLSKVDTIKFPVYLCVLTALACLAVTLAMKEPASDRPKEPFWGTVRQSWQGIRHAGAWIWQTPAPFLLVVLGFLLDSTIRLFLTVSSNYYRHIGIAEASLGVISVAGSVAAFFTTGWMEWLVKHRSSAFNFGVVVAMTLWGLVVLAIQIPGWWGVLALGPLILAIRFLQFFQSHYLNEVTPSSHRATVLSFKGMTINLAYGGVTLLFGWQMAWLAGRLQLPNEAPPVFEAALTWWPWYFGATLVAYGLIRKWRLGTSKGSYSVNSQY